MQGSLIRQLPYALVATLVVVATGPLLVSRFALSTPVAVAACVLISLALSRAGDLAWRRLPRSRDILFADLMLWGWLRRLRTERQLARAESLISGGAGDPEAAARRLRGLERLAAMIEARDAYTQRHSHRVTRYAEGIARGLGLPPEDIARVRTAAALHDVGKYFTPRNILNKPGKLTDTEFAVIKRHPGQGADLVAGLVEPEVVAMIRHHHERLSGRGYPDALAGEAIPLGARIIAVADTFDAMTSTRAYRKARPHQRALAVLHEEAGSQLDAAAVAAFAAFYSGRRGQWLSGLSTGMGQALLPLRDLAGAGGLGGVLPGIGASVALTAPLLTAGAPAALSAPTAPVHARHHAAQVEVARAVPTVAARRAASKAATVRHRSALRLRHQTVTHHGPRPDTHEQTVVTHPGVKPGATATAGPASGADAGKTQSQAEAQGTQPSAATAAPTTAATAAPTTAATSAPTSAPAVAVAPVTVQAGDVTVTTPEITVPLPDLPVAIPTVQIKIPTIKLP